MVEGHYGKLGFSPRAADAADGCLWELSLGEFTSFPTFIRTIES